ncbi:ATP-binding protein [Streptomyces sp. NPDC005012]|uniref:ATP-binding protein n=1 Tax=Streptomyces sp. NPDC005012 TaxID=3154558 RepID=UPI0033B44C86
MTALLVTATLVALAASAASVLLRRRHREAELSAHEFRRRADSLGQELRTAETLVKHMATAGSLSGESQPADVFPPALALPPQLKNTPFGGAIAALDCQLRVTIAQTRQQARQMTDARLAQARQEADQRVAEVRREAVEVARAAVRAFASTTVQRASLLSSRVSAGVRRHVSDEAYATLVEIDHLAQQMLLTASGYAVLAGERLARRHPDTTLTDVVRAAMGRVEGYQRVEHPQMDTVAVDSRAVEAVIHTVAVLLDNALRYSPPAARVHVSLDYGHDAVFVNVDDAGLRMEDERLEWARRVMSGPERDDITSLGAYPQTGLRVAAVLAAGYGFRVEVQAPNSRGGTRAFIVLPRNLLTAPPLTPESEPVIPVQALPRQDRAAVESPRAPALTTASGLTVRRRGAHAASAPRPAPSPEPVEPGRPSVAAAWLDGTRRGREIPNIPDLEGQ